MREREALEAEKKAANRTIQQQNLLITKLTETQDQMSERAVSTICDVHIHPSYKSLNL